MAFGKEYRGLFPGYYMALGDFDDDDPARPLVRIYWNISEDGGEPLVSCVTRSFNESRIPFRLKVLKVPHAYGRTDAAVLYCPRDVFAASAGLLAQAWEAVRSYMAAPVSAFAKRLAPGLGLAEDPGNGGSFGHHVSGMLAEALCRSTRGKKAVVEIALRYLQEMGLNPAYPYLRPESSDRYDAIAL
ncbi:MAG: hypothetical protein HY700_17945 [Gemmatimonadetes bacterium]|nr:hypothetical protein [Gemmatimonadota bacterium]